MVLLDVRMPGMDGFAVAEAMGPNPHMAGATIVMLTSDDRAQDQARCDTLGLSAYMIKPITKRDLQRSLQRALRRRDAAAPRRRCRSATRSSPPADAGGRLRVLVAEDNEVNVRLAVALLAKLGHSATVVGDGQAAVDAQARDALRPDPDGRADAGAGRDGCGPPDPRRRGRARRTGRTCRSSRLTARAMKGDREECLAAGMDDYVTKPVRLSDLAAAVARQVPGMPPSARAHGDAA